MKRENVRLGKKDYVYDEKTLKLGPVFSPTLVIPHTFDFDAGRSKFPLDMWGNDKWGDCAKVAQANQVIRLERLEQRRTLKLTTSDVVAAYQAETGAQEPGDPRDTGLVMLNNNRLWRHVGFPFKNHFYNIAAFGELDPHEPDQLRAAIYLLHGVQFGFSLPRACQTMGNEWDYRGETGPEWQPGSWGGHAVFGKRYDEGGVEVLTWGEEVYVTNTFIDRYCDEAWAVVDNFDNWRKRPEIDINAVIGHLNEIGATHVEK